MLLACDQWIPPGIILEPLHLNDHLGYQNLICGCLLPLEGEHAGNARFFHPDRFPLVAESQIVIAYGSIHCVYTHNCLDPVNSDAKRFGYSFGDRLNSDINPLCKGNEGIIRSARSAMIAPARISDPSLFCIPFIEKSGLCANMRC